MADFDIFNPPKTKVVKGVEGKSLLIHSDSVKCGKTTVGSQMPKPYYLRFEQGANAIDGLDYAPLTSWSDFKKVNKQLTGAKTVEQARARYTTIIFDTLDIAIKWCSKYVCAKNGVERLNDGNNGYGLCVIEKILVTIRDRDSGKGKGLIDYLQALENDQTCKE